MRNGDLIHDIPDPDDAVLISIGEAVNRVIAKIRVAYCERLLREIEGRGAWH